MKTHTTSVCCREQAAHCVDVIFSAQVKVFVTGLFSLNQDIPAFKEHLRDFLVQIKVMLVAKQHTPAALCPCKVNTGPA